MNAEFNGIDPAKSLSDFVKIYSPSRHEQKAAKFLVKLMGELGFSAQIDDAGNAVCFPNEMKDASESELLLFGHMDTVPPELDVFEKEGVLHGRGAVDAKASLLALLFAAAKSPPKCKFAIAGCTEEEIETAKGIRHLLSYCKPKIALLGEPSNTSGITISYKGRLLFEIISKSPHMHAGMESETAVEKTFLFYQGIKSAFAQDAKFKGVIMNITHIKAGSPYALNVVPDELDFYVDLRFPSPLQSGEVEEAIKSLLPPQTKIHAIDSLEPAQTDMNHPLCRALVQSIRKNSLEPKFLKKTGTSDMNITSNAGIPTIAYGPGDSKYDHTDEEQMSIADYLKSIEVIAGALPLLKLSDSAGL